MTLVDGPNPASAMGGAVDYSADYTVSADGEAYDAQAAKLVTMFADNFAQYVEHIDDDVKAIALG